MCDIGTDLANKIPKLCHNDSNNILCSNLTTYISLNEFTPKISKIIVDFHCNTCTGGRWHKHDKDAGKLFQSLAVQI